MAKNVGGDDPIDIHFGHIRILTEHIEEKDGVYLWPFLTTPSGRTYKVKAASVEQAVKLAALSLRTREVLWTG
jgi:hypothetical protein